MKILHEFLLGFVYIYMYIAWFVGGGVERDENGEQEVNGNAYCSV